MHDSMRMVAAATYKHHHDHASGLRKAPRLWIASQRELPYASAAHRMGRMGWPLAAGPRTPTCGQRCVSRQSGHHRPPYLRFRGAQPRRKRHRPGPAARVFFSPLPLHARGAGPCERRRRNPDPGRSPSACRPHRHRFVELAGRHLMPMAVQGAKSRRLGAQRTLSTPSSGKTNPQPFSCLVCKRRAVACERQRPRSARRPSFCSCRAPCLAQRLLLLLLLL